ncbi:hypothetical protein AALB81_08595 [Lachnospiraceae bacterium 48-33]
MIKNKLKIGIASMAAIVAMSASVLAGTNSYSYKDPFTVEAGWKSWASEDVKFANKASHTMKVSFNKTYAKGTASISISKKSLFGSSAEIYHDIAITTATMGIQYSWTFDNVSSGTRHYSFGSDATASYRISSFSDTW